MPRLFLLVLMFAFTLGASAEPLSYSVSCTIVEDLESSPLDEGLSAFDDSYNGVHASFEWQRPRLAAVEPYPVLVSGRLGGFYWDKPGDSAGIEFKEKKEIVTFRRVDWHPDIYTLTVDLNARVKERKKESYWGIISYQKGKDAPSERVARAICTRQLN